MLFFVHTRKLAFLTAIPMVISLVMHGISLFSSWGNMDSTVQLRSLLSFVPGLILVVLYVIQMFVRPRNPALSIIYLILAILNLLQSAGLLVVDVLNDYAYVYPSEYFLMSNVLGIVASIFLTIAYCKAMFVSRKKYYKQ